MIDGGHVNTVNVRETPGLRKSIDVEILIRFVLSIPRYIYYVVMFVNLYYAFMGNTAVIIRSYHFSFPGCSHFTVFQLFYKFSLLTISIMTMQSTNLAFHLTIFLILGQWHFMSKLYIVHNYSLWSRVTVYSNFRRYIRMLAKLKRSSNFPWLETNYDRIDSMHGK